MIILTEISLFLPNLPDSMENLRLIHMGDLHVVRYRSVEKSLRQVLQEGCDILICSGDFCYQIRYHNPFMKETHDYEPRPTGLNRFGLTLPPHDKEALTVSRKIMDGIRPRLGSYTIQGNHDSDYIMQELPEMGFTILANQAIQIETGLGDRFNLCGIRSYGRAVADIPAALLDLDLSLFTITICHYPEMAEAIAATGSDLILAGHTHGGQICLPNGRPLKTHSNTGIKYAAGLEYLNHSVIYTTRGVGYSIFPLRMFCPPEIVRFTLHKGSSGRTTIEYKKIVS